MTTLAAVDAAAQQQGLLVLGAFHPDDAARTIILLGPDEPAGFWPRFAASAEALDGAPDPMNRWSKRVIGGLASGLGAEALYPFSGPPWHPFYDWAVATGRCHRSPVGLLVHDRAGLWASFRGALAVAGQMELPEPPPKPCDSCADKPCLSACPVGALGARGYDVSACKSYIGSPEGRRCMSRGCQVRAACPVSQNWGREAAQSAFHMTAFVGR